MRKNNQSARKIKGNLPPISAAEAKRVVDHVDTAIVDYVGTFEEIEQAVGAYIVARHVGWKPLVLVHNKRTIRKFEQILGISFREEFEEVGPDAERSRAYKVAASLSNFWKAVSGDIKIDDRRSIE